MKTQTTYFFTTLALLVSFPLSLLSQHVIKGTVKDGPYGEPVPGVVVTIVETGLWDTTNDYGEYSIPTDTSVYRTVTSGSMEKYFLTVPGTNWMNFWSNPPDLPSDFDNNYYQTVDIGSQTWMQENLKTSHYENGEPITYKPEDLVWGPPAIGAYYIYDEDETNIEEYGMLYNWYAVDDSRNVCPSGWHVPTLQDFQEFFLNLGYDPEIMQTPPLGGDLKETGTAHWISPNLGATDDYGFTALPGGEYSEGLLPSPWGFKYLGTRGSFWCATNFSTYPVPVEVHALQMINSSADFTFDSYPGNNAFSVRCIMDATLPVLSSSPVSDITNNSAIAGGNVTDEGGSSVTAAGVCWSTESDPELSDNFTVDGTGPGSFTSNLTGLDPFTTYYVRAYATNNLGTAYGNEISFTTHTVLPSDSLALADVYYGTNGPGWNHNDGWLAGTVDTWYGVTVSGDRVTSLDLNRNNLVGNIPATIGNLDALVRIDFWTNHLSGSIPPEIGNLTNLTRLYLNNNELSGNIPVEIGQLGQLTLLYLNGNQLSGSIPAEISALNNLEGLHLASNLLTGGIPPEIGTMSSLSTLSLYDNPLGGSIPTELANLDNLQFLLLRDDQLTGTIPSGIWELTNLRQLHVGINSLEGTIPKELGNLANLQFLQLYSNNFEGVIPPEIGNLTSLVLLNIHSNNFTGPVPPSLINLTSLSIVHLENNQLSSLPELTALSVLDSLFIQNNRLTFDDIEPNIGVASNAFYYSPQAPVAVHEDVTSYLAEDVGFYVNCGGEHTQYQWYRDDVSIGDPSSDSVLTISAVALSDAGDYICEITNSIATDLYLSSIAATLEVIDAIQVTNNNAAGPGSLRNAIDFANGNTGKDSIIFNIEGSNLHTIQPASPYIITDPIVIDGYSQEGSQFADPGSPATLVIELNGMGLDDHNNAGLYIQAGNSTIRGLIITQFGDAGIHIQDAGNNTIEGNYIGTDQTGTTTRANFDDGLRIVNSPNNHIGGISPDKRNIISGNGDNGIELIQAGATGNLIEGNYIGIGADGNLMGSQQNGIYIAAPGNFIGTSEMGSGNVISGNFLDGVYITSGKATGNQVVGNFIGTSIDGLSARENGGYGVTINQGANHNTIGTGNIISGNNISGVNILHSGSDANQVLWCNIGTNKGATGSVANVENGVVIGEGASENLIGPNNIISGNTDAGVYIYGSLTSGNIISENTIGTDITGNSLLSNGDDGVNIFDAPDNRIEGNVLVGAGIGGTGNNGIEIYGSNASGNVITANFIGTNALSTSGLGNGYSGVQIKRDAHDNIIGPDNVISGNLNNGIRIESDSFEGGTSANGNIVTGNNIGTNVDGNGILGNQQHGVMIFDNAVSNTIGPDNVISGNGGDGVHLKDPGTTENEIIGNYIGTNSGNSALIGNTNSGVHLTEGAVDNTVGPGNVISANSECGIHVEMHTTSGNRVIGNLIGTTDDGVGSLGNRTHGIWMNADGNTIGGFTAAERNVIAANGYFGIEVGSNNESDNEIYGNYIDTDITGNGPLFNVAGGILLNNASNNIVGGASVGARNVIGSLNITNERAYGNHLIGNFIGIGADGTNPIDPDIIRSGIFIIDASDNTIGPGNVISGVDYGIFITEGETSEKGLSTDNKIIGNLIGTDSTGLKAVSNHIGLQIENVKGNRIGGWLGEERNVISANDIGINIFGLDADSNVVVGNYIGTTIDGQARLGNTNGVWITEGNDNLIGGTEKGARNVISGNGDNGVWIQGTGSNKASGNKVQRNFIGLAADGKSPLGNRGFGVKIREASGNLIGGPDTTARNIISANGNEGSPRFGVHIEYDDSPEGNTVQGNFIGTDSTGTADVGNISAGVFILHSANNKILNNVVSGNGGGIGIFEGDTPDFQIDAINNIIKGNLIGVNRYGTEILSNDTDGIGIINARDNTIGGTSPEDANIIGGNSGYGIYLTGPKTENNYVIGNYIGADRSGNIPLPNGQGVNVDDDASLNYIGSAITGGGNVIAYNTGPGIGLGASEDFVENNEIYGNGGNGIFITGHSHTVGGSLITQRNFIYGNDDGISLYPEATYNTISRNFVGTDRNGEKDLTESWNGVAVGGCDNIVVGNLIVGYEHHGVFLNRWHSPEVPNPNPVPERNRVEGNYIGLNATGTSFIPNGHGITIDAASNNILIKNTIAGNNFDGISIANSIEPVSVNNKLSQNRIFNNGGVGIELGLDGISINDEGDTDEGTNHLQNYPVIDSISFPPGQVTVAGYLNSTADSTFILEFFASRIEDQSSNPAYGEGETYVGSDTIVTDGSGNALFEYTYPLAGTSGQVITATARDLRGNTSEFSMAIGGIREEMLADFQMPFHYSINEDAVPNIVDGSDTAAIIAAFNSWMDIPTSDLEFELDGLTSVTNASATDGLNLVTFRDEKFPMPPGVLAIAAKTLKMRPGGLVADIIDADMVFNPEYVNGLKYKFGIWQTEEDTLNIFDIQSVTSHEAGHMFGLRHSGSPRATMFFALGTDTINRTLEPDDKAWASYRYPNGLFASSYSFISGNISYGDIDEHPPVAGALVLAVDTETRDMFHAYSDENGDYRVPVPVDPSDETLYWILIQPLDGDVFGFNMRPGNVSSYVYSHTLYTDYPMEWYDEAEGYDDNPEDGIEIPVAAFADVNGIDLITNKDMTPPSVEEVIIAGQDHDSVAIRPDIRIKFSEPVEKASFTDQTCYLTLSGEPITGSYTQLGDSTHIFIFRPDESLNYETEYMLHVLEISDRKENLMDGEYTTTFTTREPDDEIPYVEGTIPEDQQDDVFVRDSIMVFFSKAMKKSSVLSGFTLSYVEGGQEIEVSGSFDLDPFNQVLTFAPLNTLKEETNYTFTLSHEIEDLAGNPLGVDEADDLSYHFSTVDIAPPEVIYMGPLSNEENVTIETPVVVDFSEPIDRNTVSSSTFSLLHGNNPPITGDFEYLLNDSRIIFRPEQMLDFEQEYTINLAGGENGIHDISQPNPQPFDVAGLISRFTTAEIPIQPYLEYLNPQTGIEGTVVTIIGEGFDPDPDFNRIFFAGSEAEVISSSLHKLVTKVPYGAITGGVTVEVRGKESVNSQYFFVIPQSLDPCSTDEGSILSGSGSRGVVVSPNAGYAYITNYDSETVSVLNLLENKSEDPITVEKAPLKIAMNPTGTRAYVTNHLSHSVSVIDTDDSDPINPNPTLNKQIKVIPVGAGPYGVAVSADKKIYVANYYSENISVIDADPSSGGFNHVISNILTGSRNRDVAVTGNEGVICVTGDDGLCILEFTPGGDYSDVSITRVNSGTGTRGVTVIPNVGIAIVTTDDGNMFVAGITPGVNLGDMLSYVNTGSRARDVSASGDQLFVYVTMTDPEEVAVYSLDYGSLSVPTGSYFSNIGLTLHHTISLNGEPKALAIDQRSEKLVVMEATDDSSEDALREVTICCGPVPADKLVGDLIINIQNLVRSGAIDHQNGNLLISKLYTVLEHLDEGDTKGAINVLNTTIRKVDQMIKKDQFDPALGLHMIEELEAIIAEIETGTKSVELTTGVDSEMVPDQSTLGSIYPNPFTNSTFINYAVSGRERALTHVRLRVYNGTGQVIRDLVNQAVLPGQYTVVWDGKYDDDRPASDGIYFIEFMVNDILQVRKVVRIR